MYDPWGKARWLPFHLPEKQEKRLEKLGLHIMDAKTATILTDNHTFRLNLTYYIEPQETEVQHSLIPLPEPGEEREVILGLDPGLRIPYTGVFVPAHDF